LLVIHTIKASAPVLFHLIANNITRFKIFANRDTKADNKELYQVVEQVLNSDNAPDKMLYHKLIQFLFTGWQIRLQNDKGERADYKLGELPPQSIASGGKVDYFARAFAEELNKNELSDQSIMQVLLNYNSGTCSGVKLMIKMMDSDQFAERIEYFGKLLSPAKVSALTSEYFKAIFDQKLSAKSNDYELTGKLWRMSLDNYESVENHKTWLENQIDTYLSKSLRFTNDIFYFWKYRSRSDSESKQYPPELYKMYVGKIKYLAEKPEQFAEILRHDMPYIWALRHIVFRDYGNEEVGKAADDKFFLDWQPWLTDSLVKASVKTPAIVAMYAAPLVYNLIHRSYDPLANGDENDTKIRYSWASVFDEKIAKMLFGDDLQKIMKIISVLQEDDYKDYRLDEQPKILLDYAITHSKQWLKENKPKSEN